MSPKFPVFILRRKQIFTQIFKKFHDECMPKPKPVVVTLAGSVSQTGQTLALLLKQCPYIHELRLYDRNKKCWGVGLDLSQIDTNTHIKAYYGYDMLKYAVQDATVVVCCHGRNKQGEDETSLFKKTADDVRFVALHLAEFNQNAIFCIGTPPVEAMVPMVTEEYKKTGYVDHRKIIGVTTLNVMRANSIVAGNLNTDPSKVMVPVIGGTMPNSLVAVLSQAKPQAMSSEKIQNEIANADEDVLKLKCGHGDGNIVVSPAFAMARFVKSVIKALKGDKNCVEYAYVRQIGHIGDYLPYMASIVKLGRHGVESSHMPKISEAECQRLHKAAIHIRKSIFLGTNFVADGDDYKIFKSRCENKEPCDVVISATEEKTKIAKENKSEIKENITEKEEKCVKKTC